MYFRHPLHTIHTYTHTHVHMHACIHTYTHTHAHRDYATVRDAMRMARDGQTISVSPGEQIWYGRAIAEANSLLSDRRIAVCGKRSNRRLEAGGRRVRGRGVNHTIDSIGGVTGEENITRTIEMGDMYVCMYVYICVHNVV
jgi:hypothetical protein